MGVLCSLLLGTLFPWNLLASETSSADGTGRIGYANLANGWMPISFVAVLPHETIAIQGLDRAFSIANTDESKPVYFQRIGNLNCSKSGCDASFQDEANDREFHFSDGRGLISYRDNADTKDVYKQKKWASIFTGITGRRVIYVDLNPEQTGWTYRSFDFNRSDKNPSLFIANGSLTETNDEFIFSFHNIDYSYHVIYQRSDRFEHPVARVDIQSDDGHANASEKCRMAVLRIKELMYWKNRFSSTSQ
uniref:Uncharacterized protein n=1 Tax=uncultured bacterium CSLF42 TaxID=1091574 RepID=G4WVZ7_9BACT|nr:hypothetical protein [uncultured bacterium CSLF42]